MDSAGDQLLSRPSLSVQQHGGVGRRNDLNLPEDLAKRSALANDVFKVVLRPDFRFEVKALVFEPVLRLVELRVGQRVVQRQGNLGADLAEEV